MASRRSTDPSPPAPAAPAASRKPARTSDARRSPLSEVERRELIAVGAYLRAERRGFAAGHEQADWLAAEAEVDALLRVNPRGSSQ
jgi:Protein of unknown function (DUF2934)